MITKLILLAWMLGFISGVAASYIYYVNLPEADWLDCIELEDCYEPIDVAKDPRRIRT